MLDSFNYTMGGRPNSGLTPGNGTLFGTTSAGGSSFGGEIFTINQDGSGFSVLHTLIPANGIQPFGSLLLCGGRLYGTATMGGAYNDPYTPNGYGTIFSLDVNGSNFTVLHSFDSTNGQAPFASLVEDAGMLYGTTLKGGSNTVGTIFKMCTNGTEFTVLKTFSPLISGTNCDGARPYGGLVRCGKTLYGATTYGGTNGSGVIFAIGTNGCGYQVLKTFSAQSNYVNADGAYPYASLLCNQGILYGTTSLGGASGNGTVFKLKTDGSAFSVLKMFSTLDEDNDNNDDGALPYSGLILNGNTLYGTTYQGGTNGLGTVFKLNTIGAGFSALKHFTGDDGSNPYAGVVMVGSTLFGTAAGGGNSDEGAVFGLVLPPFAVNPASTLAIRATGNRLTLSWDTVPGTVYQVQYTANLAEYNQWTNLRGALQASSSTLSTPDVVQANSTRSYRVVVVP